MGRIGPLLSIAGRGPFCGSTEERANLSHWATIQQFYAEQVIFCFLCSQIAFHWRNHAGLASDLFGIYAERVIFLLFVCQIAFHWQNHAGLARDQFELCVEPYGPGAHCVKKSQIRFSFL
jgi:hypothetical protein